MTTAQTVITSEFGEHTCDCFTQGEYLRDWDSDCLRPSQWLHSDSTDVDAVFEAEILLDRTLDAAS